MQALTQEGHAVVQDLATRHGFSTDAVTHMLVSVLNGNGGMAQFSHPEFGGSGQWMRGGMLMIGDMFNGHLKGRVDSLCGDISNRLASQPGLLRTGSFQSQSQSGSGTQHQAHGAPGGGSSLFVPDPEDNWWPKDLGSPNATGAQNNVRYAYFGDARRLAVKTGSEVWVYDTLDHQIGGFSQQQGMGGSITFGSQYGTVNLAALPAVSRNGAPAVPPTPPATPNLAQADITAAAPAGAVTPIPVPVPPLVPVPEPAQAAPVGGEDIIASIERLGGLRDKGILTEEEFTTKKAELLARL